MRLSSDVLMALPAVAANDDTGATLSVGVEDFYPQELTHVYTSGFALAHIRVPGQAQRIIYALCENRHTRVVEFFSVYGVLVPRPPAELQGDNVVEGLSVNPQFLWIDTGDGRQRLRLYVVAQRADGSQWTLRFTYPDLPIYRPILTN